MIDNTGFATTSIGLQAIQREQDLYDALVAQPRPAPQVAWRRHPHGDR